MIFQVIMFFALAVLTAVVPFAVWAALSNMDRPVLGAVFGLAALGAIFSGGVLVQAYLVDNDPQPGCYEVRGNPDGDVYYVPILCPEPKLDGLSLPLK